MTHKDAWIEEKAREMWSDRPSRLSRTMKRAAVVLIAIEAPWEERRLLMEMADGISRLRTPLPPLQLGPDVPSAINQPFYPGGQSISEGDRITRIDEIEAEFLELCRRNSIALDQPLTEEMKERMRLALSEQERAIDPLSQASKQMEEEMELVSQSAMSTTGVDRIRNLREWMRLSRQHVEILKAIHKIDFFGPDIVDEDANIA